MKEKLKDILCCGEPATIEPAEQNGEKGYGILCIKNCGNGIFSPSRETAIIQFLLHPNSKDNRQMELQSNDHEGVESTGTQDGKNTTPRVGLPKTNTKTPMPPVKPPKNETIKKVNNSNNNQQLVIRNANDLHTIEDKFALVTSPIIAKDSGAMARLINNNIRYVENAKLDKCWTTKEGQDSIVKSVEDAMIMGAELGKMGDLVPFGSTCQFIPAVEAFEFSLTNGNNAPFEDITIECIYENDKYDIGRKDGNFFIVFNKIGIPRGKVLAVAAYGTTKNGVVIGEVYDTERLMGKAEAHSTSYQYYLRDKKQAETLRSEGKLKTKWGREYFTKDMPGKTAWTKDIFLDELTNPYDGADQPEMLRKSAGKSFFGKFIKVRNSEAAMDEVRSSENMRDGAIKMADRQFENDIIEG